VLEAAPADTGFDGNVVALVQGCKYSMLLRPVMAASYSICEDVTEYEVVGDCFHSGIEAHTDLYIQGGQTLLKPSLTTFILEQLQGRSTTLTVASSRPY
jgi:hypothetical protein